MMRPGAVSGATCALRCLASGTRYVSMRGLLGSRHVNRILYGVVLRGGRALVTDAALRAVCGFSPHRSAKILYIFGAFYFEVQSARYIFGGSSSPRPKLTRSF
eukprot:3136786-Prymnesium_polylepis.1